MTTPYDRKILLVGWRGRTTPGDTIAESAALIRGKMPNVAGVMLKTSNGVSWQGYLGYDSGPKAITGVTRIRQWVEEYERQGLEVHVWGVPRAKRPEGADSSPDIEKEAAKFISAANIPGVKSLLLDVEHGEYYWQGSPDEVEALMTRVRAGAPSNTHIGMVLDGRKNRRFDFWVDPWIPFIDSLHPMVYPVLFGISGSRTIEYHLDVAFNNLGTYNKPIVPMLQAFGEYGRRPTSDEIVQQGNAAWTKGATGLSFFRLGSDIWSHDGLPHMGEPEYAAIAAIPIPGAPGGPAGPTYTWQDVINASTVVAIRADASWDQWLGDAGVWGVFNNALRPRRYSGPPVEQWPIAHALRRQILELLRLDSAELIRLALEAQTEEEEEKKAKATQRRREHGSIIGIHGASGAAAPRSGTWDTWIDLLKEMGIRWYKQCDNGDPNDLGPHSMFGWAKRLKQEGIEPIIRYLVSEQFPDSLPDHHFEKMRRYAAEGIVWAEIGNEPNLDHEWKSNWHNEPGNAPMRHTNPEVIRIVAETWVKDAKKALDAGVRPAFYAFAPTDWKGAYNHLYSSVFFTQKVVGYLAQHHRAETIDIFERGGWIAVHAATYEQPVDFDTLRTDGTIWDMTLRSYEVVQRAFRDHFSDLDIDNIAMMSTEGGVFTPESTSMNGHDRLSTNEEHAQRVVEMFRWLERHSPLQAMCPWCLSVGGMIGHFDAQFQFDGWIEEVNGQPRPRAVYEAMRQLRFDHEREAEREDEAHETIQLNVPYISQYDETARTHLIDSGPTSLAMILNANKPVAEHVTVDELYARHLPDKDASQPTLPPEMERIGRDEGLAIRRINYADSTAALQGLQTLIQQGTPFVALVNYGELDAIAKNNYGRGLYMVVTGFDGKHVFVHDPLFRGARRNEGRFFVWRNQRFLDAWGSSHEVGNLDFVAFVPEKQVPRL